MDEQTFYLDENYAREVWKRVRGEIKRLIGVYGKFGLLAEIIGFALYFLYQVTRIGQVEAVENLIDNGVLIIAIDIVFVIIILPYIRYYKVPRDLYLQQRKRELMFWPRGLDLDVSAYTLNYYLDDQDIQRKCLWLKIRNGSKTYQIMELEARITDIAQTRIDSDVPVTLMHFPGSLMDWEDWQTEAVIRPDESKLIFVAEFSQEERQKPIFGRDRFVHYLFEHQAVYQISIEFMGKVEGELEFRRFNYMTTIYSDPTSPEQLLFGNDAIRFYPNLPKPFVKVIEVGQEGRWFFFDREKPKP